MEEDGQGEDCRARVCDNRSCCYSRLSTERLPSATIVDLENPFNVYALLMLGPSIFVKWQMTFGLLKDHVTCKSCNRACNLQKKSDRINGMIWCCTSCASKPTQSVRNCSFFSNSHLHLEVILIFIYTYMTGLSFKYCSTVSGMHYKNTALDCGNFVRDIMVEFVYRIVMKTKFSGIVEIAESLFNRKIKYHCGRPLGR